jgi:hypothetical protein
MTTEITVGTLDTKSEPERDETHPRIAKSHYMNYR